jgi:hypothetical protein
MQSELRHLRTPSSRVAMATRICQKSGRGETWRCCRWAGHRRTARTNGLAVALPLGPFIGRYCRAPFRPKSPVVNYRCQDSLKSAHTASRS